MITKTKLLAEICGLIEQYLNERETEIIGVLRAKNQNLRISDLKYFRGRTRVMHCLAKLLGEDDFEQISLQELSEMSNSELLRAPGFGRVSLFVLRRELEKHGFVNRYDQELRYQQKGVPHGD